jgi:hypothetical protein
MSPAALEQRVAVCRVAAQALLADLQKLVGDVGPAVGVYGSVRGELECAVSYVDAGLDYLTPRADDGVDPDCCAHRALQKLVLAQTGARS